eukprot:scaffold135_cov249-Pinguiococcus_pyrenoidosus.AAC.5
MGWGGWRLGRLGGWGGWRLGGRAWTRLRSGSQGRTRHAQKDPSSAGQYKTTCDLVMCRTCGRGSPLLGGRWRCVDGAGWCSP